MSSPIYGWYGDDFTGATDTLATIARRGRRAFLFLAPPEKRHLEAVGDLDAIGIAGAARAMNPQEMAAELEPVGRFFRDAGVSLLHYKCCSTFDSAPHVGNIATAIETLRPFVDQKLVPIIGGQPSLRRYCAFSNLFASGNGGMHRLDRHPTMSRHPSTPMGEADLARHLQRLGLDKVACIDWTSIDSGSLDRDWSGLQSGTVLFDALTETHIAEIGRLIRTEAAKASMLIVGASSVAEAFFPSVDAADTVSQIDIAGPVLAFAGSLSPLTRTQIEAAQSFHLIPVQTDELMTSQTAFERVIAHAVAKLRQGQNVLISTAPTGEVSASGRHLAERSAELVDAILNVAPVGRLAIAGGDTSSVITNSLGLWGLGYAGRISDGVALCRARSDNPLRDGMLLMLKGGQMGDVDLFDRFAGFQTLRESA
jgi:uncharacterized protein YgbK (DUF1537 family)